MTYSLDDLAKIRQEKALATARKIIGHIDQEMVRRVASGMTFDNPRMGFQFPITWLDQDVVKIIQEEYTKKGWCVRRKQHFFWGDYWLEFTALPKTIDEL